MLKKIILALSILFTAVVHIVLFPIFTEGKSNDGMSFSMVITTPDNQIDKEAVYYDLLIKPSTQQELKMTVTNMSDKENKIKITPANAETNENGVISYIPKDSRDANVDNSSSIQFTSLVEPAKEVILKPLETREVSMKLTIPEKQFTGEILGSLILDSSTDKDKKVKNGELRNEFQIKQGVLLRESLSEVPTQFAINDIKSGLYQNQLSILTNIQNVSPKLMKNVSIKSSLRKKDSTNIIVEQERSNIDIAPSSTFNYPLTLDNHMLTPGEYTMDIQIVFQKEVFFYSKNFDIAKNDVYLSDPSYSKNSSDNIPILKIIFIIIFIFLLAVFIYYMFRLFVANR